MIAGVALGVLIGIVTGIVFLLLLRTANRLSGKPVPTIMTLTTELLAIPTFWFAGPWVTSGLLELVPLGDLINPYIVSLAATFVVILIYPAFRWIVQLAEELGTETG